MATSHDKLENMYKSIIST